MIKTPSDSARQRGSPEILNAISVRPHGIAKGVLIERGGEPHRENRLRWSIIVEINDFWTCSFQS
jgi:hypothetical protein